MAEPRVVIVGAGPAGVRAAEALIQNGLRPTVVEEGKRDGGQIYRRQPDGFTRSYKKLYGSEAGKAKRLHQCFDEQSRKADWLPGTLAWNIEPGRLHVLREGKPQSIAFDALIVCSGATDRLMPIEGWDLAGCYSLGAAQVALKSQACSIGRRVAFLGTGPLLYLVASQYVAAGAKVEAVLDTSPFRLRLKALPWLASRAGVLWNGFKIVESLRRANVRMISGVQPVRVHGSGEHGVAGVEVRSEGGDILSFECDAVAVGFHLRAESQLADLAGAEFRFDAQSRQWLPAIDEDGRTSVPGIYLAGDGVRLAGADAAEDSGRLAALACLNDLGKAVRQSEVLQLRSRLRTVSTFRSGLQRAFPWPYQAASALPDSAVLCRCEAVTVGELRAVVAEMEASELNRSKALCRVGMGRCQGRYCGHAAAEVIAHAANVPIENVGRIRSQGPIKPLAISTEGAL